MDFRRQIRETMAERENAKFQRDVDAVKAAGRTPLFYDGKVLFDAHTDDQSVPHVDIFTFVVRPTPTTPYNRRYVDCVRTPFPTLHIPLHLTTGKRNPIAYYQKIITYSKIEEVAIDVSPANIAVQELLGGVLRSDWYLVRLYFRRDETISNSNEGDGTRANVLHTYSVFPTESEFKLRLSLGGQYRQQISRITLSMRHEELEEMYIDSRKTQFSFCLIVSRFNYVSGGSMRGARMREDYRALELLCAKWREALLKLKIRDWRQSTCDEIKDMRWVLIMNGPWRTREPAKQLLRDVFAQQTLWHVDEQASDLFEPRAPNFVVTTATLDNGQQRTYRFARNPLRHLTWRKLHSSVLDAVLVLLQINLPPYVVLDIIDNDARVWPIERIIKIRMIESVRDSIRRVRERQLSFEMRLD